MKIISLSGVKQSGKNTCADLIKEIYPNAVERSFAYKLKKVCSKAASLSFKFFNDQNLKEKILNSPILINEDMIIDIAKEYDIVKKLTNELVLPSLGLKFDTPRKMLQFIGTDFLRNIDTNIHLNSLDLSNDITIITDTRFQNELDFLKEKKASCFYIHRKIAEESIEDHPSEKGVLDLALQCLIINNNGSLSSTKQQLKELL